MGSLNGVKIPFMINSITLKNIFSEKKKSRKSMCTREKKKRKREISQERDKETDRQG